MSDIDREYIHMLVDMDDRRVTMGQARDFGGCVPGWKAFCASHGLDWRTCVKDGILASELLSLDDAMAYNLVLWVYTGKKEGEVDG